MVIGHRAGALPRHPDQQRRLRDLPHARRLPDGDPCWDGGLHGNRDDLEHGRGGAGLRHARSREGSAASWSQWWRSTPSCPRWRCRRCRSRTARPCWRFPRRREASPTTPSSGWSRTSSWARSRARRRSTWASWRRRSCFIATNAGLIGVSRLTYSMGQYRQLPEGLRRLHPKYRTPYIAIVVFGVRWPASRSCPGQAEFLGTIYAFGAMLSFTIAHVAVVTPAGQASRTWSVPDGSRITCACAGTVPLLSGVSEGSALASPSWWSRSSTSSRSSPAASGWPSG